MVAAILGDSENVRFYFTRYWLLDRAPQVDLCARGVNDDTPIGARYARCYLNEKKNRSILVEIGGGSTCVYK